MSNSTFLRSRFTVIPGDSVVRIVGPGGAGKSTAGAILADRLGVPFLDLDRCFEARLGNIDYYIAAHGYPAYTRANVEVYRAVVRRASGGVLALSSGFMTYAPAVHPRYAACRAEVERHPGTVVLLPSLDLETCVAETVRRQLARPFGRRDPTREEAVIRARFPVYAALEARRVETMRPPAEVAAAIAAAAELLPRFARTA